MEYYGGIPAKSYEVKANITYMAGAWNQNLSPFPSLVFCNLPATA